MKKIFLLLIVLTLTGCNTNKLITNNKDDCNTVVEGFYAFPQIWNSVAPAIVFKNNNYVKYGTVIKRNPDNIVFVEKKTGIFHTPDTLIYPLGDIRAIIDSTKECTFGNLPERYAEIGLVLRLYISKKGSAEKEYKYLELRPNQKFSYCLEPGIYSIKKIEYLNAEGIDESDSIPFGEINIEQYKTNYLGNISMITTFDVNNNVFKIPFKQVYSNSEASAAAAFFGILGALAYDLTRGENNETMGYYRIAISDDPQFTPLAKKPVVKKIIK